MSEVFMPHGIDIPVDKPVEGLGLTEEQKDSPRRENILHPTETIPLAHPISPFEPPRRQPHALLAKTIPLLGQHTEPTLGGGWGIHQPLLADFGELAFIPHDDGSEPELVVQFVSGNMVAREIIPPENRDAILDMVQREYPEVLQRMTGEMEPDTDDMVVVAAQKGWLGVERHRARREHHYFLSELLKRAPSGRVRIERLDYYPDESMIPETMICEPMEDGSIHVRAGISEYTLAHAGHRILPVDFYLTPDGVKVDESEVIRVMAALIAHRIKQPEDYPETSRQMIGDRQIIDGINDLILTPLHRATLLKGEDIGTLSSDDGVLAYAYEEPLKYVFEGFGQELIPDSLMFDSVRFFDVQDDRPTLRTIEDIHTRIFATPADIESAEAEMKQVEQWWKNDIVPKFRDWTPEQIEDAAEYLKAHRQETIELIKSKFAGDTRLVVIGMMQHPHFDHLPFEMIEQIPDIDFIAVEVRPPDDNTTSLEDDRRGMIDIPLGNGMTVSMSYSQAKEKYPEYIAQLSRRNNTYDSVIADAEARGIKVIYTMRGKTWKEMNTLGPEEVAVHMKENPGAKGVYFTSVYGAMKWPGYQTEAEQEAIGFGRPLTTASMFDTNPRSQDTSERGFVSNILAVVNGVLF